MVVTAVRGSAPREVGAAMLVWRIDHANFGQSGTIGGGALEFQAVQLARNMLAQGDALDCRTVPLGPNLGQCCGGSVQLLTEVFDAVPADGAVYARPVSARAVSARAGDVPMPVLRAKAAARRGEAVAAGLHGGWFIEPCTTPRWPLWIWGAGHVGRAIVQAMAPLPDVEITWVDTDLARFPRDVPMGVRVLPAPQIVAALSLAPLQARHVIVTFSHAIDLALCDGLLRRGFSGCGVIGSATKWARFSARLAALDHSEVAIARIQCPIGAPEFGKHPQAIALGVAASILADRAATARDGEISTPKKARS